MEKKRTYGVWAVRSSTSIFGPAQSWCKENGKPLEFDSKADAENYAKEANEHTTANVRYYVKEKEPEPGAVRKGTSQPELDARSHEEVTPRNDAAEKQNEIPGRQIPSQTDPLVEIRSAVHSNYAGMVAMLGADNCVYLGREERCYYQDMQPSYYDNQDGSLCFVCDQPDMGRRGDRRPKEVMNPGCPSDKRNLRNRLWQAGRNNDADHNGTSSQLPIDLGRVPAAFACSGKAAAYVGL